MTIVRALEPCSTQPVPWVSCSLARPGDLERPGEQVVIGLLPYSPPDGPPLQQLLAE